MVKRKILITFGTRPEALKFAPIIRHLSENRKFKVIVCLTGQHREMLDQVVDFFNIPIDDDMKIMEKDQTLETICAKVITHFRSVIERHKPDLIFVQGDTTTAFMTALAGFFCKVPIAHLEAGLRTGDKFEPFPEEVNRKLLSSLADFHFAPTQEAVSNLRREGILKKNVYKVGNSIVDTIGLARNQLKKSYDVFNQVDISKKILFVTAHRRESFGQGIENICKSLLRIKRKYKGVEIVYPVHLNPNVLKPVTRLLGGMPGIHLLRPLSCEETYWMLENCHFIMTDSGGIQEEAPSFKKPVLVLRKTTERPEGVSAGVAKLVGTDTETILKEVDKLLRSKASYMRMVKNSNPYGDGKTSKRVAGILERELFG